MVETPNPIRPLALGGLRLPNNLAMAAMHKRTHLAMRLLSRRAGASLTHTEMASPEDILGLSGERKSRNILASTPEDRPLAVQLVPREAGPLVEAIAVVLQKKAADVVDLNFACPSKRIAGTGRGAAMLQCPEEALPLVEAALRAAAPLPVTLKMRLGYTDSPEDRDRAMELARGAAALGVAAITLHARSAVQQYHGRADWETIGRWAADLPIPIVGSGDLRTPEAVVEMLRTTGCAGASIARGAVGSPWIFRQVLELAATGSYRPVLPEERRQALLEHYEMAVWQYGERGGLVYIRQVGRMYTRGIADAAAARVAIQNARGHEDLLKIADRWLGS